MATIIPTNVELQGDGSVQLFTFAALTTANADTAPIEWVQSADRCVQVSGTWGAGGTAVIEGSNDGVTYVTLFTAQGVAASFTANSIKQIVEVPRYARCRVTAGDGTTNLTAMFVLRRANPLRQ